MVRCFSGQILTSNFRARGQDFDARFRFVLAQLAVSGRLRLSFESLVESIGIAAAIVNRRRHFQAWARQSTSRQGGFSATDHRRVLEVLRRWIATTHTRSLYYEVRGDAFGTMEL